MADGTAIGDIDHKVSEQQIANRPVAQFAQWLVTERSGLFTLWAVLAFLSLVAAMAWQVFAPGLLSSAEARIWFFGATTILWLPLLLLLMDSPDNIKRGPSITLPAISLALLGALTVFVVVSQQQAFHWISIGPDENGVQRATKIVFFVYFALAFVPNIWGAAVFAKHELGEQGSSEKTPHERALSESQADAEAMSALMATLIVAAIGVLAFGAGEIGETLSFANSFGLMLCAVVVGVFTVVVFLDSISEWYFVRKAASGFESVARAARPLANFYNAIDTLLVRIIAFVSGMGHHSAAARYLLLAGQLGLLLTLGWWLPAPLGLLPCFVAAILAISVSRLWSWVEEDRALAAMTEYRAAAPYKIGFREDFRDETLLGFIFIFALAPIAMMQAHVGSVFGDELFLNAHGKGVFDWVGYFGIELAKAVPIVDWAEIYSVSPGENLIQMNGTASRHAVFLARVTIDLVLIAALLQAIAISGRNRQQKRLYDARHIRRLDVFVERRELERAIKFSLKKPFPAGRADMTREVALQYFDLEKGIRRGAVDFRHYDENRISDLHGSSKDRKLRAFFEVIAEHRGIPLAKAIEVVVDIAEGEFREMDMFRAFERAKKDHHSGAQKMDADDLYRILVALRNTSGLREFKFELLDLLTNLTDANGVLERYTDFLSGNSADRFNYTRKYVADNVIQNSGKANDCAIVQASLKRFEGDAEQLRRRIGVARYSQLISAMRSHLKELKHDCKDS